MEGRASQVRYHKTHSTSFRLTVPIKWLRQKRNAHTNCKENGTAKPVTNAKLNRCFVFSPVFAVGRIPLTGSLARLLNKWQQQQQQQGQRHYWRQQATAATAIGNPRIEFAGKINVSLTCKTWTLIEFSFFFLQTQLANGGSFS